MIRTVSGCSARKPSSCCSSPPAQESGLGGEVDGGRGVLGDVQQSVLDAELGVLQAEVEGGALLDGHPPDRLPLGHRHRQPQGQPGLAHLG